MIMLPYLRCADDEVCDRDYNESDSHARRRAKVQPLLLKHLWRQEYLTSLREFHKTTENNVQKVKVGDIVLVHDDTPRVNWKLAVIQQVIKGKDGLIRAANIRTASGITNRPITKLYPLEINASSMNTTDESLNPTPSPQPSNANVRPVRGSYQSSSAVFRMVEHATWPLGG